MLEFIRDRAQGWFAWAIVILLVIPFAMWGVHEYIDPEVSVNVAEVDGKEIPVSEYQQTFQQQRARLQSMLGSNFNHALLDDHRMKSDVLEGIIDREILLSYAEHAGLRASDARVASEIRAIPAVQNDGQFDKELYERLLRSQGLSVNAFEHLVRNDVLLQQLRSGVADTAFVTQAEIDALIRLSEQRRDVGYLIVPVAKYLDSVSVDDAAVAQYYKDNQAQFHTPEQVSVDYIELSVNDLAGSEQPITEDDLRQRYEEHKSEFTVPEARRARQDPGHSGQGAQGRGFRRARAPVFPRPGLRRERRRSRLLRSRHHGQGLRSRELRTETRRRERARAQRVRLSHHQARRDQGRPGQGLRRGAAAIGA